MPTSVYIHTQLFVERLDRTRPKSILDIGIGNGKNGFLVRDYLDGMCPE